MHKYEGIHLRILDFNHPRTLKYILKIARKYDDMIIINNVITYVYHIHMGNIIWKKF